MRWIAKISGVLLTFALFLIGSLFAGACNGVAEFVSPTPTTTPTNTPTISVSPPTSGSGVIELKSVSFKTQDGDGDGIVEEFILDTRFGAIPGLPVQDGVDLGGYDLEFTFQGGGGKSAQLWYKNQNWVSVYSFPYPITSGQPIHYNPLNDGRNVDEFDDFTHIFAIGAKVEGGVEGVQIISAKLIDRSIIP